MKKWKFKEIVKGKTFPVFILTTVLTFVSVPLRKLLWQLFDIENNHILFLAILLKFNIISLILSFFISVFIMKLVLRIRNVSDKGKRSRQIVLKNEKNFKWHIVYTVAIGGMLFFVFNYILGMGILAIVLAVIIAVNIHKTVDKNVETNRELIMALQTGELNAEIPRKFLTKKAMTGITNILRKSAAITLEGAIVEYGIWRILLDIVLPVMALIIGIVSIFYLFGLDNINLSYDDFGANFMLGFLIHFDVTILCCTILAVIIRLICQNVSSNGKALATTGMIISIICLVISVTPVGDVLPILSYSVFHVTDMINEGNAHRIAQEGDYLLSNVHVGYSSEDVCAFAYGTGTITNTTEYDWKSVTIGVRLLEEDGGYGKYDGTILECTLNDIRSGESAEFETESYVVNGFVEYGTFTICEVVSVQYDIDLREKK